MPWRKVKNIGMTDATKKIGVSSERLRYWELKGIVSPAYIRCGVKRLRRYSHEDVVMCTEIKRMIDREGYTLKGAAERLHRPYGGIVQHIGKGHRQISS